MLAALVLGFWANIAAAPLSEKLHEHFQDANPLWAPITLGFLVVLLASPLLRAMLHPKQVEPQLHFLPDDEISDASEDVLAIESQARSFAEAVLASGAQPGLIFGVDGPWGYRQDELHQLGTTLLGARAGHHRLSLRAPEICGGP